MAVWYRTAEGQRVTVPVKGVRELRAADKERQRKRADNYGFVSSCVSSDLEFVLRAIATGDAAVAVYRAGYAESREINLGKVFREAPARRDWTTKYTPGPRHEYPTTVTIAPELAAFARGYPPEALNGLFNAVLHARARGSIHIRKAGHDKIVW